MNQLAVPEDTTVELSARIAITLLRLAYRAPLLDAERMWLESVDTAVTKELQAQVAQASAPPVSDQSLES